MSTLGLTVLLADAFNIIAKVSEPDVIFGVNQFCVLLLVKIQVSLEYTSIVIKLLAVVSISKVSFETIRLVFLQPE